MNKNLLGKGLYKLVHQDKVAECVLLELTYYNLTDGVWEDTCYLKF